MRKKILATLLALCLVIGLLPITALAAELTEAQKQALKDQGYTDEEIANVMVIDEDTELTEDFDGLVVVVGSVNVTVKGANIGVGLVVAPGAAGAKITLGENAVVNAVVALEKSDITVSETAQANSVTATAADTVLTVEGTVSNLGAAASAENVTINVTAKANVSTMNVAAPNAKAEIAGTVGTVNVEQTAAGASLKVAETGNVTTASVSAPNTAVTVDGTVSTVDVAETATGAQVGGANADKVEVTGAASNVTTATDNGTVEVGVGGTIEVGDNHLPIPGITVAPLGNKYYKGNVVYAPGYGVNVAKNTDNDKMFDVTIVGTVPKHFDNDTSEARSMVGIAIPLPTKTTTASDGTVTVEKTSEYVYYMILTETTTDELTHVTTRTVTIKELLTDVPTSMAENITGSDMLAQGVSNASLYALYDTITLLDASNTTTMGKIGNGSLGVQIAVVDKNDLGGEGGLTQKLDQNLADALESSSVQDAAARESLTCDEKLALADADVKDIFDEAQMILNIMIEVTAPEAEFITIDADGKPSPTTTPANGAAYSDPSHPIVAVPSGTIKETQAPTSADPNATEYVFNKDSDKSGVAGAVKDSAPETTPSYTVEELVIDTAAPAPSAP